MKVYNREKTKILDSYDLTKGYLQDDYIDVPEVQAVAEKGHYETIREYENGGKDVEWVVEVEGVEYKPAHQEQIQVYIPYTPEELQRFEDEDKLSEVLTKLGETDYIINKMVEAINEQELNQIKAKYAKTLAQRRKWRQEANDLKEKLCL